MSSTRDTCSSEREKSARAIKHNIRGVLQKVPTFHRTMALAAHSGIAGWSPSQIRQSVARKQRPEQLTSSARRAAMQITLPDALEQARAPHAVSMLIAAEAGLSLQIGGCMGRTGAAADC